MNFIVYNNQLINRNDLKLSEKNRGFLYGDGFFESIKIFNRKPFNFENHFKRIQSSANYLDLIFKISKQDFLNIIIKLLENNKIINGYIRISVFRESLGKYCPDRNDCSFIISSKEDKNSCFTVSSNYLNLGVYKENLKSNSKLSNLKSLNSLLYVMASKYALENKHDDVLLLNTHENIIESTNSNLFICDKGVVFTPPLSDGCVDGSMRKLLLSIIKNEYEIKVQSLSFQQIQQSEEIILSNAISGVRRVTHFANEIYSKKAFYNFLIKSLNSLI